jgi:hypothetical protein
MNYAGFLQLVSEMRVAQNVYFKIRTNGALIAAKELEKKVDKVLSEPIEEFKFPQDYETKRG